MGYRRSNLVDYRSVEKVTLCGQRFDSKAESRFYLWLLAREQAGEIKNIRRQVEIELLPGKRGERVIYKADFVYTYSKSDEEVVAEYKGFESDTWLVKKRMYSLFGPRTLEIWKEDRTKNIFLDETIIPKRTLPGWIDEFKVWLDIYRQPI